jgi:hypothetical protein
MVMWWGIRRVEGGFCIGRGDQMGKQYRQGDVLLVAVDSLPPNAAVESHDGRLVLAYGEVTGHAHAVNAAVAQLYTAGGAQFLQVSERTELVHEEHASITLEPGLYRVVRQREYSPREIRRVSD